MNEWNQKTMSSNSRRIMLSTSTVSRSLFFFHPRHRSQFSIFLDCRAQESCCCSCRDIVKVVINCMVKHFCCAWRMLYAATWAHRTIAQTQKRRALIFIKNTVKNNQMTSIKQERTMESFHHDFFVVFCHTLQRGTTVTTTKKKSIRCLSLMSKKKFCMLLKEKEDQNTARKDSIAAMKRGIKATSTVEATDEWEEAPDECEEAPDEELSGFKVQPGSFGMTSYTLSGQPINLSGILRSLFSA